MSGILMFLRPGLAISAVLLFALMNEINGFYAQPYLIDFISHPQSRIVVVNYSVTFHCSVNKTRLDASLPNVTLTWFRDGDLLNASNNISCFVNTTDTAITSTCYIKSVQMSDQGWYRCHVTDGTNSTLCRNLPCIEMVTASKSAHLKVIGGTVHMSSVRLPSNSTNFILDCLRLESHDTIINHQIVWKRNGEVFHDTGIAESLPSNNLLITANETTVMNVVGVYECLIMLPNGTQCIVSQTNVLLPLEYGVINNNLSVTLSPRDLFRDGPFVAPSSLVELVCLFSGVSPLISWSVNNEPIHNSTNKAWLSMSKWIPGNYCCHSNYSEGISNSCLFIDIIRSEPPLISTIFIDQYSTVIELNCSSSEPVQWLHNGRNIDHNATDLNISVSNKTLDEVYGIYQCNKLNQTIAMYRLLPYGWTNPVPSVHPVTFLPVFNMSLHIDPPTFTGGLDKASLSMNVTTRAIETLISVFVYHHTLMGRFQIDNFIKNADYSFQVTVVDGSGESISETTTFSFGSCSLYEPAPPLLALTCGKKIFSLNWTASSLDPYPFQTTKHLNIRCYNDSGETLIKSKDWLDGFISGSIAISAGDNTTVCHFSMYGVLPPSCSGALSTGVCSHKPPVTESSEITSMATIPLATMTSLYPFTVPVSSTGVIQTMQSSMTANSHIINVSSSSFETVFSTTPSYKVTSLPTSTSITHNSTDPPKVVVSDPVIMAVVIITLFCFLFIFVTVVGLICVMAILRNNRLKRHHVFNSKEFNEVELYSDITFSPALDEDTVSIKTCYDSLDLTAYAIHTVDDEELHSAQKKMITAKRLVERNANTDPNQVHSTDTTNSDFIDTDSNNVMKSDAANRDFANHLSHRLIVTAMMEGSDGIVDFNYLCTTENGVKLIRLVHRNDTLSIAENNDNPITTDKVPVADKTTTLDDHRSNSRSSSASSSNQHQYENMHQVVVT